MKTARKISDAIVTAAFVAMIASPLLVLAVRGAVEPYGRIPFTAFPPVEDLSVGSSGAFDHLASALLERSQLKKTAITIRNTVLLRIARQYDHNNVASGKDGWLFWKDDWFEGQCQNKYDVDMAVARIGAMLDVGKASGIDMYFAIAPDKSTLYPEFLDPHFKKIWGCKQQSADLLRSAIKVEAPEIIDHLVPLQAAKADPANHILYGKADTHWTNFGAAVAFRQLLGAIYPGAKAMPPPALTGKMAQPPADMETTMLLVGNGYPESEMDTPAEKKALFSVAESDRAKFSFVLHDSFYNKIIGLTDAFRHGAELNFDADPKEITKGVLASDRLVVSRVERAVVNSVLTYPISWPSTLGMALVARNELAARECRDFAAASGAPGLQAMAADTNGYLTTAPDPQMVVKVPVSGGDGKIPCIRLRLTLNIPDTFEIYFSPRDGQDGAFVAGRSIQLPLGAGDHTVALVLPDYLAGRSIRIDPGDSGQQTTVKDVEFGWRPAATGSASP